MNLPGDRSLQNAVDYGKQNLADLTQTAEDLAIRFVDRGKSYPRPIGSLDRVTFIGAGYPDYPWLFATDGEYTAFAAVALGQFEPIKDHLIALQQVSDRLNAKSGKVAHEIVTDGSVYFGSNTDPGNTDESVKFPSAVALVWRWSGDNRFLNRLYDFSRRAMRYVVDNLDADKDGWPEGLGNVEREGMGGEKLDNTVYLIRGLTDLAEMAAFKRDRATDRWASQLAATPARRVRQDVVERRVEPVRGLAGRQQRAAPAAALDRRHADGDRARAARPRQHGARRARDGLLQRLVAVQPRPLPHGLHRRPGGQGREDRLQPQHRDQGRRRRRVRARVAAPLHGRERRRRARRAARRAARDPAVARSEPEHRPLLDVPLDVHAGLGPLRHGLAGDRAAARRAAGRRAGAASTVVPKVPEGQERIAGNSIRIGDDGRGRGPCPCATTTSTRRA